MPPFGRNTYCATILVSLMSARELNSQKSMHYPPTHLVFRLIYTMAFLTSFIAQSLFSAIRSFILKFQVVRVIFDLEVQHL